MVYNVFFKKKRLCVIFDGKKLSGLIKKFIQAFSRFTMYSSWVCKDFIKVSTGFITGL